MEEAGLLDRKQVALHNRNTAPLYFGSPITQQWWALNDEGWGGRRYEVAGPIVKNLDENFMKKNYDSLRIPAPEE